MDDQTRPFDADVATAPLGDPPPGLGPEEGPSDVASALGLVSHPTSFGIGIRGDGWEVVMVDKETGEIRVLDRRQARLGRMRKRLSRWGDVAGDLVREGKADLIQVTSTYAPGRGWRACDMSECVQAIHKRLGLRLFGYCWVAELQEDRPSHEAVHYLLYLLVAPGTFLPKPDKAGLWPHGMTRVEANRRGIGYAMKYAQKVEQKGGDFPKGLRLFAVTFYVNAPLPAHRRRWFRLSAIPRYAEQAFPLAAMPEEPLPKRAEEGGGYLWKGLRAACPWSVSVRRVIG